MKTHVPSWCKPWPCSWCWSVVALHTRRICCHGLWLQFHPGLLHFSTKELNTLQWLLQIYIRMCLWQLSTSIQFVVWWSVLKTWSAGTWRDQGAKEGTQMRQWMLAIIWISMECLSWDFLNSCEFSCLKNSRQISSTPVQLKKMFIFEVRDEQVRESDFFSASPEPYCNRKCKVLRVSGHDSESKGYRVQKIWKKK